MKGQRIWIRETKGGDVREEGRRNSVLTMLPAWSRKETPLVFIIL
jgi:hypothetical protein